MMASVHKMLLLTESHTKHVLDISKQILLLDNLIWLSLLSYLTSSQIQIHF